ncbi:MAG: AGE family epimerase/isomerase [Rhodospirillales bacterium]|nr:AGE family epimerase/isomerase [Rhodospirillales bacterium]
MTETFTPDQVRHAQEVVDYTFNRMARLCATSGWDDSRGGTRERLLADLTPAPLGYRRGMVVGRQLFFFSHAYRLTADPVYRNCAQCLFEDLAENFWDSENGGWYFSLGADGGPADTTKDLYGHAFIMFGLAHYLAIFGGDEALNWIGRTNEIVFEHFELPEGWFAPATTRDWSHVGANLEQNPHMHLLEAYLSIYRATDDDAYLECAARIMSIYTDFLRTSDLKKVLEHLDESGRPSGEKGTFIQPGHLYEWYWLVGEYADIAGQPALKTESAPMIEWADQHCLDTDAGGMFDLVDISAHVLSDRKRNWPMTERIKALATLVRDEPAAERRKALTGSITFFLEKYCRADGSWHEYLTRDLRPDCGYLPLSTPYHVAMAALEVERLFGGPGAFGMTNGQSPEFR